MTISKKEIENLIFEITEQNKHILDCYPATVDINAPRALLQIAAKAKLEVLYLLLKEKRPTFKCDNFDKVNY